MAGGAERRVSGAQAGLTVPSSVRAFRARGSRRSTLCPEQPGSGRADRWKVRASQAARLKWSRTVAARRRLPRGRRGSRAAEAVSRDGAAAGGARTLRLTLRVSVKGRGDARAQGDDPVGALLAVERSGGDGARAFRLAHRASARTRPGRCVPPDTPAGRGARGAACWWATERADSERHGLGLVSSVPAPDRPPLWLASCASGPAEPSGGRRPSSRPTAS